MTFSEGVSLGTQILIALGVLGNIIQSFMNGRKIETVHHATNSMKDELVAAVRSEATAAGIAAGRAEATAAETAARAHDKPPS